jgi:uncharacterized membrane protein YgcG
MKKSKSIMLIIAPVLSTLLFNACGGGNEAASTRDVYQSKEDCAKDWGEQELCEQMNDEDDRDYRSNGGAIVAGRPFYGPQYYPSDRTVIYKGNTISPTGKSSSMKPYSITSRSSASSRSSSVSSPRSTSASYGGFGGRSSGGSS